MQKSDVRSGIQTSWDAVQKLGLGETYGIAFPLEVNEQFRSAILDTTSTYTDIYLLGMRLGFYNFLLMDYSFFQFSWEKTDHIRYAYYPNPFLGPTEQSMADFRRKKELVDADFITHEEFLTLINDAQPQLRIPCIRYENAPDQHRELRHPCSHLHIGHHGEDRWAISRVLTPLAFTLIILKYYYSGRWEGAGKIDQGEYKNELEDKLSSEKKNKCVSISNSLFSAREAASFFFG